MATRTAKEIALEFGTTGRTLRKFLRSEEGKAMTVGKGQRWAIEAREVRSLRKRFAAWEAAKALPEPTLCEEDADLDEDIADQDEIDRTTEEVDEETDEG